MTLLCSAALALCGALANTNAESATLPSIYDAEDADLQRGLERVIAEHGFDPAVADHRFAVAVAEITDLAHPRVAHLNGNLMLYAASLPKLAILLGAFQKSEQDGIPIDADLESDLTLMIRYSNNDAATRMLEWVGRERLARILMSPGIELYDADHNGGLWVGKDYGPSPAFRRDPLHGISHGATALQVVRFYYLLQAGRLASPADTRRMKAILSDPAILHKFVKGLEGRHDVRIFRKSGTWGSYHSDSALVEARGRSYVLVALVIDAQGERWLEQLALPLYRLVAGVP